MAIDFTSHLHQTKRKVLHWQTFMQMTINYLNSSHIILETRIYEIDLYGFEARLNNPSSIEHGGTSTLYNFMEKFFGTKRLHKRIWKSDGTSD